MNLPGHLDDLLAALGGENVVLGDDRLGKYLRDRSETEPGRPLVAVRPDTVEGVSAAVRWAAAHRIPVVPRGAGSGLSGGATAIDGCLVLSLERLTEVSVDAETATVTAQAGALTADVKAAAAAVGLWYPPDPSSYEISTIGGNVATNAGGLCCVKYGVTRDYVLALDVVLADGSTATLGSPLRKDVAGLDVRSLFIGSEGALGIVLSATLRLLPAQRPRTTAVAYFQTAQDAARAVVEIRTLFQPCLLELMDQTCLRAVEEAWPMGIDVDAGCLLLAQFDDEDAQQRASQAGQVASDHGATEAFVSDDEETADALLQIRRLAVPALERRGRVLLDDVGVPVPLLPALFAGVEDIAQRNDVEVALLAHAGDGNAHPSVVLDPTDEDQQARGWTAYGQIMDLAIALGGTITGEHGVGRLKTRWLAHQLPLGSQRLQALIKESLDPRGIMNPGAGIAPGRSSGGGGS